MNASSEMRFAPPGCACATGLPRFWENLLHDIRRRKVVPILGKDLLVVEVDGRSISLDHFLAEKLAENCGQRLDDKQDMRHAIAIYKASLNDPQLHYLKPLIRDILRNHPPPIPKSLLQLAAIEGFPLYVTTTFDSLLHSALVEAKRCPADQLLALAFDPTRGAGSGGAGNRQWDLPRDFDLTRQPTPVVYHLFGMDCADPDGADREEFAVTEEELLEYVVHAEQPNRQPGVLFEILHRSRLLVLGTSYPDWLARFFLRLATVHRIFAQRNARQLWVDRHCKEDPEFTAFLRDYSSETEICFSEDPVRFVDRLYDKWQEDKSKSAGEGPPLTSIDRAQSMSEQRGGKIFISYASEDRPAAASLVSALETAGLDVWWDREIEAARKWDETIERQIEEACAFIALLSRRTTVAPADQIRPPDRVFRSEWSAAFARNKQFFGTGREFIIPLYIDDVEWNAPGIEIFTEARLQGVKALNGIPPEQLIETLRTLQRDYRRTLQR